MICYQNVVNSEIREPLQFIGRGSYRIYNQVGFKVPVSEIALTVISRKPTTDREKIISNMAIITRN